MSQKMSKKESISRIIELTLREVRDQGWDLIDEYTNGDPEKAVSMVYDAIEEEL